MGLNDLDVCDSGSGLLPCFWDGPVCPDSRVKRKAFGVLLFLHSEWLIFFAYRRWRREGHSRGEADQSGWTELGSTTNGMN